MEVFFGEKISLEELDHTPLLRWIHLPTPSAQHLPLEEIEKMGNILVTYSPEGGMEHHGEWAIAAYLAFAKGFFSYRNDNPLLPTLSISHKTWLECPAEGTKAHANAFFAKTLGLRVLGIRRQKSFSPHVDRTYSLKDFHALLPHVDIISMSTLPETSPLFRLKKGELELIKKGAILILSTEAKRLDLDLLTKMVVDGHFQGVAIDTKDPQLQKRFKDLKNLPNLLLTPGISLLPKPVNDPSFPLFRHLLRDYAHENFVDMGPRLGE